MTAKRKRHTAAFKAQVALAALKGDKTVNEIASHFGVHPTLIHGWKKHLLQGAEALFANGTRTDAGDAEEGSHWDEPPGGAVRADRPAEDGAGLGEKKSCRLRLNGSAGWSSRATPS
jgi:Transposase